MPEPRDVIARVPRLEGMRPVRRLGGGEASESWLLEGPPGAMMLRMDLPLARALGLDRAGEFEVLRIAHDAGLAPEPLYSDPRSGVLVTRYLPGRHWRPEDLKNAAKLEMLGCLLRDVHGLPVAGRPFEPVRIAEHYALSLEADLVADRVRDVAQLARQLLPAGAGLRTMHGDPNAANIIGHRRPRLIDWEYAAAGDPLFDLAVVIRHHALDARRADTLLRSWSGGAAAEHRERLQAFVRLYDLLTGLWLQVVRRHAGT